MCADTFQGWVWDHQIYNGFLYSDWLSFLWHGINIDILQDIKHNGCYNSSNFTVADLGRGLRSPRSTLLNCNNKGTSPHPISSTVLSTFGSPLTSLFSDVQLQKIPHGTSVKTPRYYYYKIIKESLKLKWNFKRDVVGWGTNQRTLYEENNIMFIFLLREGLSWKVPGCLSSCFEV